MTNLIFSFDTEDFTSPYAANGILDAAELLRSEGIRGCFCLVGLLARQLLAWGRTDILQALQYHEVNFHTYGHTLHPTIAEYTDCADFTAAYREVIRQETEGLALVKAAAGVDRIYAAVPPGADKSYAAMYAYADLGIPCYCDTVADTADGRGVFFCNALHMAYDQSFESIHEHNRAQDPAFYDRLASRKNAILYNHPNRLRYRDFWDAYNYKGGNLHPFGQWAEASRLSEAERLAFLDDIRGMIRRLKADGRFTFKTYAEIAAERSTGARILKPEDMPAIRRALLDRFYPLDQPFSLSIADVFSASAAFLRGDAAFACGRVFGFLEEPFAVSEPVTVTAGNVRTAAQKLPVQTFLPTAIPVGETLLGPADFLFAMLGVCCGESAVTCTPRPQNIDLTEFPNLPHPAVESWGVHVPSFTGRYVNARLPLQAWTIRF